MPEALAASVVEENLKSLDDWEGNAERISRTWSFDGYGRGVGFAMQVALLAERRDHHPQMVVDYGRVTVSLWSHDAGGVTERDCAMAQAINDL